MKSYSDDYAKQAHDYLLDLSRLAVRFAQVERAPRYPTGDRENDVEHSFHLALLASELAADYYPELDVGLVSQYSLVHDLPESYVGDTWTFGISDEDRAKKELAESKATQRLLRELPPHTAQLLKRYEKQIEPEARFVRLVDKLTPAIINMMAGDANTFSEDHGVKTLEELIANLTGRSERLQKMFPEFEFVHMVRELISKTSAEQIFKKQP
ncbi:MAG TPA: HD domain-containing protein [Candidatus Saccharimonadales bacterium]|nr:HD domain-containing protein [Candidatus Saccharimonadales bacterium]